MRRELALSLINGALVIPLCFQKLKYKTTISVEGLKSINMETLLINIKLGHTLYSVLTGTN